MVKKLLLLLTVISMIGLTSCLTTSGEEPATQQIVIEQPTPVIEEPEPGEEAPLLPEGPAEEVVEQEQQTPEEEPQQIDEPIVEAPPVIEEPEPEPEPEPLPPADLHEAVLAGDTRLAESFILEDVESLAKKDAEGNTPLHLAALLDDESMVKLLLKHGAERSALNDQGLIPAAMGSFQTAHLLIGDGSLIFIGESPLIESAFSAGPDALEQLLGEQYVNSKDASGQTVLHHATKEGLGQIVQRLIELGADLNREDASGEIPLDLAFARTESDDHVAIAVMLIENYSDIPSQSQFYYAYQSIANKDSGIRFEGGTTVLHFAASHRHPALMRLFIERGAYLEARDEKEETALHIAVQQGFLDMTRILVDSGSDMDARDARGQTPLHLSIREGLSTAITSYLLSSGASVAVRDSYGDTPLSRACEGGIDPGFVSLLLGYGADPNSRDSAGNTPLMTALAQNNIEAGQLVLEAGADIHAQNYNGITPLVRALIKGKSTIEWFYTPQMNTITDPEGEYPLHIAVNVGASTEVISQLLAAGHQRDPQDMQGNTPLHLAVSTGYPEAAALLTQAGCDPFIVNNRGKSSAVLAFERGIAYTKMVIGEWNILQTDRNGDTPLHLAALWNTSEVIDYLLSLGAAVNSRNELGITPLHYAVKSNNVKIVRLLADHGAVIDARDNYGNTPLHTAISWGSASASKLLLLLGADVQLRNLSGNTPLHTSVLHQDLLSISMLTDYGASLEARDNTGMTPLLLATRRNFPQIAAELLELGADYNTRDDRGNTPLHEAVRNKNEQICGLLALKGADIYAQNRYGDTPLSIAFKAGSEVVGWFVTGPMVFDRDNEGNTPLHTAIAMNASSEVIISLIEKGSDVNSRNNRINTPLHTAILSNNKGAVTALIAARADLFSKNGDGQTPLTLAFDRGVDTLSWLITPSTIDSTDQFGNTVLHAAAVYGSSTVIEFLLSMGADPNAENLAGNRPSAAAEAAGKLEVMNRLRILEN